MSTVSKRHLFLNFSMSLVLMGLSSLSLFDSVAHAQGTPPDDTPSDPTSLPGVVPLPTLVPPTLPTYNPPPIATVRPTVLPTVIASPTSGPTGTPTASPRPTVTATASPRPTVSPSPRVTTSPSPRVTASPSPRPSVSPSPRVTASPSPRPSISPSPRVSPSPRISPSPRVTSSPTSVPTTPPVPPVPPVPPAPPAPPVVVAPGTPPGTTGEPCPRPSGVVISIPQGSVGLGSAAYGENPKVVPPGTTVIWINDDTLPHTVTSDTGLFDSGTLNRCQTFEYTFNDAGSFPYHCEIHPSMTGTVQVQ